MTHVASWILHKPVGNCLILGDIHVLQYMVSLFLTVGKGLTLVCYLHREENQSLMKMRPQAAVLVCSSKEKKDSYVAHLV